MAFKLNKMNKEKRIMLKKNIKFIVGILVFFFGLGLIIFADKLENKLFGLAYLILGVNSL